MPGKVKVKIISGRNLPVMDRSSDTTDAYVEIKLGSTTYKTDVCRKSLHPQWNSDWYRFEVDDSELQDEPLQIRLMDHDTYSANDAIGKVYLDLNPLLLPAASSLQKWNEGANAHEGPSNSVMTGWIPVYDTMHGIRGEVNMVVKVELFTDFNKFRQSSCGVQFFCSPTIPHGYFAQVVHGFVEELVVNDDPEYQWIDKIRTPRASNEARQTLFFKLSGELQRKIGLKALDLGGNAVIGYSQSFDLEGESGIVARGIGTAVTLMKLADIPNQLNTECNPNEERAKNYLKFLGSAKGFFLNTSSNILFRKPTPVARPSPAPSVKSLKLDELMLRPDNTSKLMTRHLSDREFNTILRPPPKEMIHHSTSLQTLLKQEDMRGTPSYGFSQKIRNLKYSSQNILSRKMFGFKPKPSDTYIPDESDNADTVDAKKRHAFKYRRTQSDSTGMAEILVRSVFHATSSLDCIAETPNTLKSQTSTVQEDINEDASYLSLPGTSGTPSSNASTSSSDTSSLEDEDALETTTNVELDTVSHIVETVRKLSMIQQAPTIDHVDYTLKPNNLIEITHDKLLYVVGDDMGDKSDEGFQTSGTIEPDNLSLLDVLSLEVEPTLHETKKTILNTNDAGIFNTAFCRELSFNFNRSSTAVKKSPSVLSFSDMKRDEFSLGTQFSSLHNIHDACSKMNKYSVHEGKETVLGHLFKRIKKPIELPTAPVAAIQQFQFPEKTSRLKKSTTVESFTKMEANIPLTSKFNSLHNIHDASAKMNKYSAHEGKDTVLGHLFRRVEKLPVKLAPLIIKKCDDTTFETNSSSSEKLSFKELLKEGTERILQSPKVLFNKLDNKLHKKDEDESLLKTALGNVLTETVNDILATSNIQDNEFFPANSDNTHTQQSQGSKIDTDSNLQGNRHTKLPMLILKRHPSCPEHPIQKSPSPGTTMKPKSADSSLIKDKIFSGPRAFFHRLDSKLHRRQETEMKSEGLLHTALGNVLMDSVNEVLATSSTKSNSKMVKIDNYSPDSDAAKSKESNRKAIPLREENVEIKSRRGNLLNASKKFFKKLDSKFHKKTEGSKNKDDASLLGTALGNVLMDSVQEILATSSPSSPNNPKFDYKLVDPLPDLTVKTVNTEIDTGNSNSINTTHACLTPSLRTSDTPPNESRTEFGHQRTESVGTRMSHSPAKLNSIPCILRRSSDSDLSITPKGNSLTGSDRSGGCSSGQFTRNAMIRSTVPQENFDIMEYPFLTMSKYPTGFIAFIGGSVSARSVKLLERITNIEEPESRDTWWSEIRMEIRSHARALHCNAVLGYVENTSICDDVCVLSASGTAAVIGYQYSGENSDNIGGLPIIPKTTKEIMTTSLDRTDFEKEKIINIKPDNNILPTKTSIAGSSPERENSIKQACNICHLPYGGNAVPLRNSSSKCSVCRSGKVPDVLIATIEMPDGIPSVGRGCFVQSYVCRPLRDLKGESNAKEISDGLPFLEYELHRLLINKLKVKGMNSVFGLKVRISVGERMLIGIATGTAVFLSPLPQPPLPKLMSDRTTDEKKLAQLQKSLHDTVKRNKEIYQLKNLDEIGNGKILSDTDDSEDEQTSIDLSAGNKDCCILEVDDPEDVDVLNSLMEPRPPDGFHVVNTELVPGLEELEIVKNLQMFTQIWRAKIQPPYSLDKHFHRLLQSVYFKLRRMIPCALCDLQFRVDSPEPDEIQLCVLGMALGLGDPQKNTKAKRKNVLPKRNDDELIFNLEEDQIPEHGVVQTPPPTNYLQTQTLKHRQKSPVRNRLVTRQRHVPYRERHGVDITPLSYVPGGKIEKYLGNLNFFFIRETTSIREEGGLSGFIHSFVTEILAIVRAHVTALGGNAMVAYFITECVLNHNLHKNQGQCLINVGGDVVYVTYYSEDH